MRWPLLLIAFAACDDAPPPPECRRGLLVIPAGGQVEDPLDCERCVCTAAGELECGPLEACRPDGGDDPIGAPDGGACPTGGVIGRACAPDESAIPGARITVSTRDCAGRSVLAEGSADEAGHFRVEGLAPGAATVTIGAGSFQSRHDVQVEADRVLPLDRESDKTCLPADAARLAVISGDYDRIEAVLEELGFEYDVFCGDQGHNLGARALLGDWERLSGYDIVFFDCGAHLDLRRNQSGPPILANLRRFVQEGGSVYASDLTAGIVSRAWPGAINFELSDRPSPERLDPCCTCVDCPPACGAAAEAPCIGCCVGPGRLECPERPTTGRGQPGIVEAQVLHPTLQAFLGGEALTILFDLGAWVRITGVTLRGEVLVRANGRPMMAMVPVGEAGGRIAYTSFHNRAQASDAVRQLLRALIFQL